MVQPISLVSHTTISGATGGTTPGINTTSASLIIISVSYISGSTPTPTDSYNNTWLSLTSQTFVTAYNQLFYVLNPIVGPGHTFSTTGTTSAIEVASFSNVLSFASIQNGTQGSGNPIATGSVSPLTNNCLIVSGINFISAGAVSINSGFTITNQNNFATGVNNGGALAYLVQTSATAANPQWTLGAGGASTTIAVFTNGSLQLPYWNKRLQQNINAYQDVNVNDDETSKNITQFRKNKPTPWARPNLSVAKFVQYSLIVPPDNAINVAKFVQYVVLETPAYIPVKNSGAKFAAFFQNKPPIKRKSGNIGGTLGRRIYNFMIT